MLRLTSASFRSSKTLRMRTSMLPTFQVVEMITNFQIVINYVKYVAPPNVATPFRFDVCNMPKPCRHSWIPKSSHEILNLQILKTYIFDIVFHRKIKTVLGAPDQLNTWKASQSHFCSTLVPYQRTYILSYLLKSERSLVTKVLVFPGVKAVLIRNR